MNATIRRGKRRAFVDRGTDEDNRRFEAAIVAGDREAVAKRVLRLAEQAVAWKLYDLPRSLDFDDLVQEAAIDAVIRLAGWEKAKGRGLTYAFGAIRFVILDRARKARRAEARFSECNLVNFAV